MKEYNVDEQPKSADNTAERHAIGHILRQPPKEEPKLEFPTDTAGKNDHDACLFRGVCDCPPKNDCACGREFPKFNHHGTDRCYWQATDTSEEWKERFDNTFDFVRGEMNEWEQIHYDHLKAFIEKELEHTKQRSFEEGQQSQYLDAHYDGWKEGRQSALSKVKEILTLGIKTTPNPLKLDIVHNAKERRAMIYNQGYNAALYHLLDHLKTIE